MERHGRLQPLLRGAPGPFHSRPERRAPDTQSAGSFLMKNLEVLRFSEAGGSKRTHFSLSKDAGKNPASAMGKTLGVRRLAARKFPVAELARVPVLAATGTLTTGGCLVL